MGNLRPNGQRARNAIALVWVVMILDIVSLISSYLQYNLLETVANGGEISEQAANANDTREQIIAILYLIFFIFSAVLFILWFRRAYYNLGIHAGKLSYDDGWAAGSWFVPILCWFRPFQIMKEMYVKTKRILESNSLIPAEGLRTNMLGLWWALWIINNVLSQIVFRTSRGADTVEELGVVTVVSIAESLVGIPLAIITVKVIRDYSNMEHLLFLIPEKEAPSGEIIEPEAD